MTQVRRLEPVSHILTGKMWLPLTTLASLLPRAGAAQVETSAGAVHLTVEAYANLTGGAPALLESSEKRFERADRRLDAAVRLFPRFEGKDGTTIGPRIELQSLGATRPDFGDRSLVLLHPDYGRIELGYRFGLPDTLFGYAPNVYLFVGVEFGPPTGLSLFPQGGVQTAFLDPAIAGRIAGLSYLGITTALAGDHSAKVIYVSPRIAGFQIGASASPSTDDSPWAGHFGASAQFGLLHETYFGQNALRFGGSYSFAQGQEADGTRTSDLHSTNLGATLILDEVLSLGLSASSDGRSGSVRRADAAPVPVSVGVVASANYEYGPATFGGFLQWASAAHDANATGRATLRAVEVGASWRTDPRLRFYGSVYGYGFDDQAGTSSSGSATGLVFVAGVRGTL